MTDTITFKEQADRFNRASDKVKDLSWREHYALVVSSRKDCGERFETLRNALRDQYGYFCHSLPLPGYYDDFCDNLKSDLDVLDLAIDHVRKKYNTRGYSSSTMNVLHARLPELTCCKISQTRQCELYIDESEITEGYAFHKSLLKTIEKEKFDTAEVKQPDTADMSCH